jgi:hypothetical protein
MIRVVSTDEGMASRALSVRGENRQSWISRYFLASKEAPRQPVGFMVEKRPNDIVHPHFHAVNQFQVIVGGYGRLGKFPVRPFSMHYTNGFTGYGPIYAEDEGIAFFTLRNHWDPGAKYLPAQRAEMRPAPKRHRMAANLPLSDAETLTARSDTAVETLVEPEQDGLASWFVRVAPNGMAHAPRTAAGGGQYALVAGGALLHEGRAFPRLSLAYVSADEGALPIQAGPEGVELLLMQFPNTEARPPE